MQAQEWVVLYSREQDAYHVEPTAEYRRKGPGKGDYQPVAYAPNEEWAVKVAANRRAQHGYRYQPRQRVDEPEAEDA